MLLSLHSSERQVGIRACTDDRVVLVSGIEILHNFWLYSETGPQNWNVDSVLTLKPQDLKPILELKPDIILFGTGAKQIFPEPAVMAAALTQGIGLEVMNNSAAARTFNVLLGEGRNVVLAMLLNHKLDDAG